MVDTLIVGAGTAGCLLAARLSAVPGYRVLVLEAGPVWPDLAAAPPAVRRADRMPIGPESPWVWRYRTGLTDGPDAVEAELVRGRLLGGSAAVNGGYFVRATAADFAAWTTELGGCGQWALDTVLPAYRQIERDHDFGAAPGHGLNGPIPVRRTANPAPVSIEFAAVAAAAGFPEIPDLNALPDTVPDTGFGPVPCNVADGMRGDTASACLLPVAARPNLTVAGGKTVIRIVFRGTRAVGVEYQGGTIAADRVVLCAGAVESAALLLRSGIGDPARLRELGIEVVAPAPVGAWFSDHPEAGVEYRLPGAARAGVPVEYALTVGDVEIRPYTFGFGADPHLLRVGVALMRPRSVGELRLRSADPAVAPALAHRYLADPRDREALRAGVAVAADLVAAMPGARLSPAWRGPVDSALLRANLGTSQHLSGTCRMGRAGDERAVVDQWCGVHGVRGLSVVDLSVVPVPLGRGPAATVMMVAQHVANHFASHM
ncbi:mycofactocin dehydrogenase MftG [Nocardia arizonensis]|uniref:mycofactocin dehydrogenase MftG n=1 Tax=Nocardia arizonensis TaxID=1141647 RepID=UPI0006CFF5C6|nr:mycofactocin system GMC family oxidoreductase MftG [Nocardia arizonensis]